MNPVRRLLILIVLLIYPLTVGCVLLNQRKMIFMPSHREVVSPLKPWVHDGRVIGYCREVENPSEVWLMTHGNAGQAADREYVLPCIPKGDGFYVLEYPGYGQRAGEPSMETLNAAAVEAYHLLRNRFPDAKLSVLGESIGSGAACSLAMLEDPPDRIVLAVPFDSLVDVASHHIPWLPVSWILRDKWDNLLALEGYRGEVVIYGAIHDEVIPIGHAKRLAQSVPQAKWIELDCGHNQWSNEVVIGR